MNIELSERIKNVQDSFSKGQKSIAAYIMKNYDKVAFMTASKLGKTVGVSESTVVRFATVLGYSGYPELQEGMQDMIKNRLTSVERLELVNNTIPFEMLLNRSIEQDIGILETTKRDVSSKDFYKAVEAISKSETIYLIGTGSAYALATFLFHYLNLIFDRVVMIDPSSEAQSFGQMIRIKENDVLIGISFPRYSKKVVKAMKFGASKGACVVAITDNVMSPISENANYVLAAKSDTVSFVDSLVAPLSLINALIVTIATTRKEKVVETLNSLEDIWDEYGIYEKVEEENNEV